MRVVECASVRGAAERLDVDASAGSRAAAMLEKDCATRGCSSAAAAAFNRSAPPLYRLTTEVQQSRRPLGRRIDDTATRYELTVRTAWSLTPVAGGEALTGTETVTTTYGSADQPYAAIAAQQDGEERAAAELARLIRLDVMQALAAR